MQERSPDQGLPTLPTLSAEARRSIAARAASLDELRVALAAAPPQSAGEGETRAGDMNAIGAWLAASAPGDVEAFGHRLSWDGLDLMTAAWLLTEEAASQLITSDPPWTAWLDRFLEHAAAATIDVAGGPVPDVDRWTADGLPYAEVLLPMVRAAEAALDEGLGEGWLGLVASPAREAWARQLARELAGVAQLALHQRFEALRAANAGADAATTDDESGPDLYQYFVLSLLHQGLPALFEDLPVLARHLAVVVGRHVDNVERLVRRLGADQAAISQAVAGGRPVTPIEDMAPALSDPHDGRQRVAVLTCAGGLRLVYKPRDVRMEFGFSRVLDALAARGCASVPRGIAVLARDGYGWESFAESQALASIEEVRAYHRRAGGLLCVAWLLGGRDLHMENVVATAQGPVLVDLEALFAPGDARPAGEKPTGAETGVGQAPTPPSSCLQTGLLTYVSGGPDTPLQEVGGLRGRAAGTSTLARRVWRHLRTRDIHFVEDTTLAYTEHHAVMLAGERQRPEDFATDLADGFADAYRSLDAARDEWLAPGGVLEAFAGTHARVFTRDTNQYGMLLHVLAGPKYQGRGVRRSIAYDVLARGLVGAASPPAEWAIVEAERAALDALDVPRFTQPIDGTAVFDGARPVLDRPHQQPGFAAVVERWRAMSPDDLARQRAAILRVLEDLRRPRFTAPWPSRDAGTVQADTPAGWRECAAWIGREVLARGQRTGDTLTWGAGPDGAIASLRACTLHDGALGPALLLAALAQARAGDALEAAARQALRAVVDRWRTGADDGSAPIGATTGLGSVAYGLCVSGVLLDDPALVDTAMEVARALTPDRIAHDPHLDVVAGAAGAALALLAVYRTRPEAWLLAAAVRCGDRLLAGEDPEAGGVWRAPAGYAYTGFAHGVAGIAAAFARLAETSGLDRFQAAASRAYARLASVRGGAASWPIAFRPERPDGGRDLLSMTAWCHGAPGITLALLAAPAWLRDSAWRGEIETAVQACRAAATHKTEHVCCGNLSRAEATFAAARGLASADAEAAAARIASGVVRRAMALGHLRLSAVPYDYRVFDPAFFQGTSGAGYQLLRMAGGGRLPSVIAVEGRSWWAGGEGPHGPAA